MDNRTSRSPRRSLPGAATPARGVRRVRAAAITWTLAVALAAPLACSGAAPPPETEATGTADLIALLPAEATTVAYADFAAVRQSPLYDFARREGARLADPDELEEMLADTGIDAQTDLYRLALAVREEPGEQEAAGPPNSAALVLSARFDRAAVEQKLAELPSHEYGGATVYELANWSFHDDDEDTDEHGEQGEQAGEHGDRDSGAGEHGSSAEQQEEGGEHEGRVRAYLALLDDSTVVVGTEPMVHGVLDVRGGAPSVRANETLMGLIEDVDAGSELWFVSASNPLAAAAERGGARMPQIPVDRIRELICSVDLGDGFRFELRGRTESEDDAKLLGDSLNGMLAFGKMMLQSRSPEVFAILDQNVRAGSSGHDVTVHADLTMEQIETLYRFARSAIERERQGEHAGS